MKNWFIFNFCILGLFALIIPNYVSAQQITSESTHQPTVSTRAWYIDPTWKDLSYRQMGVKVKGDKIIAYEDPFTKQYVDCDISYRKMSSQEKSQMNYYDSQGRSYEFYVGNVKYIAQIGKLTIYFEDDGFGNQKLYTMDEVSQQAYIYKSNDYLRHKVKSIEEYIKSGIKNDINNPNPLGDMEVSFIVNRDGKISDVQILKTPDPSLNSSIIARIKGLNTNSSVAVEAAKFDKNHKDGKGVTLIGDTYSVDCLYRLTFKVKTRITKEQGYDIYVKHFEDYFSKYKDNIDYVRSNISSKQSELSPSETSSKLKDLSLFINEFPLTKVIQGTSADIEWADGTIDSWNKIIEKLFKSDKSDLSSKSKSDVYISLSNAYPKVLKNKDDNQSVTYLLNQLNDKIYYRIIENAVYEKIGNRNFIIPRNLKDVAEFYTKAKAKNEFKQYFERHFNNRVDELKKDPSFGKLYSQWEESYYFAKLGELRNVILNKDKTKIIGDFKFVDDWYPYSGSNSNCKRSIFFKNNRPYMLYPLQKNGGNNYRWGNRITISTNRY